MARRVAGHVGQRELRRPLLPREVAEAHRAGEPGVALRPVGEQQQMVAVGIGRVAVGHPPGVHLRARLGLVEHHLLLGGEAGGQGDLGAEHRRQPDGAGRLGEADDPVEAVVIGEGEGVQAQPGGLGGQLLGMRRAVEEREVGVAVELGVGHLAVRRWMPSTSPGGWNGCRRRLHAGPSPPAFHDGLPGARPSRPGLPDKAASSSFHVHDGLLNPTGTVSNDCPPNASS